MALVPFPGAAPDPAPDEDDDLLDPEAAGTAGKMSFLEHLDELRKRIIRSVIFILIGFGIAFFYYQEIFLFVMRPMQQMLGPGQTLIYTDPGEAFILNLKLALMGGVILAAPGVMSQVWLFIAPGLYAHEKKLAIPFVVMSTFFFVLGAAFSHYIVFPMTWKFFQSFTSDFVTFMPRIEPAFSLYLRMMLAFGIVFQLPTIVLFLARMGVLTAKFMLKQFKYAVLLIFIISAVVTPDPSPVTQLAMAGPLILLYLIGIALAWMFGKKKRGEEEEELGGA